MIRKSLILFLTLCLLCTFAGCNTATPATEETVDTVTVRYLNFKPEVASVYSEIADAYKQETGRTVLIETAANNTYEQTLTAKMATSDAPTIFQINGPRGYTNWAKYCADLSDTALYQHLTDRSLAVTKKRNGIRYSLRGRRIRHHLQQRDYGAVFCP